MYPVPAVLKSLATTTLQRHVESFHANLPAEYLALDFLLIAIRTVHRTWRSNEPIGDEENLG